MRRSVYEAWKNKLLPEKDGYREVLSWDPFRDWEINRMPESRSDSYLIFAHECSYASLEQPADEFLRQALTICGRIEEENKLATPRFENRYPFNKGVLLRAKAYCSGILPAACEIVKELLEASSCFETWCVEVLKGLWDDQVQSYYLGAVRMALIAGDVKRAQELLKKKKRFSGHSEQHHLLQELAERDQSFKEDKVLFEEFESFFDTVRDPHYKPQVFSETAILRLEIGLLWDKYVTSDDGQIDWRRAIRTIAS